MVTAIKQGRTNRWASNRFIRGFRDGLPICLGYVPVALAFGMRAVQGGLAPWVPTVISMTSLTGTGQFAGLDVILAGGAFLELAMTTFIINIRYMLMSLVLSQKLDPHMTTLQRCLVAFGNTDEIFAVAVRQEEALKGSYMAGLILSPFLGWTGGTLLGATAASLLPPELSSALGITVYGMFIAIIVPPARKSRPVLLAVVIAVAISCLFRYTPLLSQLSSGWVIIIAAVIAAGFCALRYPVEPVDDAGQPEEERA